ncbi:mediator of RNA polymerase II transcription subunit 9 [Chanodichthys erythropterus]|uniref:mediator of RNA polymerase II transcription subunit 9 n=1 Tax=Chanodichthys erythropterus TaxID=933992 RepID=UPI00351E112B
MATAVPVVEEAEDYSFLPIIHDVIKCMDKESPDVHQELNKLKTKIQEAREQISAMPGIDMSPALQESRLQTLREQVQTKNQLLQKYKSLCMFDIPKPS